MEAKNKPAGNRLTHPIFGKCSGVYYGKNSIAEKQDTINLVQFRIISAVGALAAAFFVNSCIDGKKLARKLLRRAHP